MGVKTYLSHAGLLCLLAAPAWADGPAYHTTTDTLTCGHATAVITAPAPCRATFAPPKPCRSPAPITPGTPKRTTSRSSAKRQAGLKIWFDWACLTAPSGHSHILLDVTCAPDHHSCIWDNTNNESDELMDLSCQNLDAGHPLGSVAHEALVHRLGLSPQLDQGAIQMQGLTF
jgi:hypothetical protein